VSPGAETTKPRICSCFFQDGNLAGALLRRVGSQATDWLDSHVNFFAVNHAALLVVAPILIGWLLRRSWRRRQSVMKAMR